MGHAGRRIVHCTKVKMKSFVLLFGSSDEMENVKQRSNKCELATVK